MVVAVHRFFLQISLGNRILFKFTCLCILWTQHCQICEFWVSRRQNQQKTDGDNSTDLFKKSYERCYGIGWHGGGNWRDFMVSRLIAANFEISTNIRVCTLRCTYQVIYVEKAFPNWFLWRRWNRYISLVEVGVCSTKSAPLKNEPLRQTLSAERPRGRDCGTILNKSAFLLGTQAVSGIKD